MVAAYEHLTQPIVKTWDGLLRRAKDAKKNFNDRGDQVRFFYSDESGFMFKSTYMDNYLRPGPSFNPPKFKVSFNKAFEFIALMWPMLFWQMADRKVRPFLPTAYDDAMSLAGNDPRMQQIISGLMDQQAMLDVRATMRAQVQEKVLNLLPRVQPGGGLVEHASMAVFDALLYGAGFLTTENYRFPASDKNLVGSFRVPVKDVFVDADCRSPLWDDAGFIAIRHFNRVADVETWFGYQPGTLKPYASKSSAGAQYDNDARAQASTRNQAGQREVGNVIEWYEIYSRAGTGNKLTGKQTIHPYFDEIAGDYCYLCICPGCPWPLNMSALDMELDGTDEAWAINALKWPTEFWRHNKWPINKLTFYPHSSTDPWPLPPLTPCIGELTVANILISAYTEIGYANRQQILAVFEGACDNLQELLSTSKNPVVITLHKQVDKSINDVLQFAKRPEINGDVPKLIEFLFGLIEQRTGMSPVLYGMGGGGANSRSAAEYQGRRDTVNIRPDFMRKRVGEWMSETAAKEMFAAYTHMTTADIEPDVGPIWALAWRLLVENEDPDVVLRSSDCYVEASDIARPNKERDTEVLTQMVQYVYPVLAQHLAQTGDPGPINGFTKSIGSAANIDVSPFLIPDPAQQSPEQQQSQQQQVLLEQQKVQAEIQRLIAEAARANADAGAIQARIQTERMVAMAKAQQSQVADQTRMAEGQMRLQAAQVSAQNKAAAEQQRFVFDRQKAEHEAQLRERQAALDAGRMEHEASLRERDAELKTGTTVAQAAVKNQQLQAQQQAQADQAQMQREKHHQSMQERQDAARQKLFQSIWQHTQQMDNTQSAHDQQSQLADDKMRSDVQRSNMIANNKMLMMAIEARKRQQNQSNQGA